MISRSCSDRAASSAWPGDTTEEHGSRRVQRLACESLASHVTANARPLRGCAESEHS